MIRFGRIKSATYLIRPLVTMDFNAKDSFALLTRVRFGRTESWKFGKKIKTRFISIRFDFDLIRIKLESFTVLNINFIWLYILPE